MTGKVTYFLREMSKIVLSITILMCMVLISLYVLKKVPAYIQESEQKFYSSVEEAEYSLGLRIFIPSYFPDYLIWPPKEIKVVRKPSLIITLLFLSQGHGSSPSLVIHQIISNTDKSKGAGLDFMEPKRHSEETQILVGGAKGTLKIGVVENGNQWIQLSWEQGDRKMVVISNRSVEDLLKIARSIHH
jgi:hypothetical protein